MSLGFASLVMTQTCFFVTNRTLLTIATLAGRRNIVICTTSIISGNKMMATAIEKDSFGKAAASTRPTES